MCKNQADQKEYLCALDLVYSCRPDFSYHGIEIGGLRKEFGAKMLKRIPTDILGTIDEIVPVPYTGLKYAEGLAEAVQKPYVMCIQKAESHIRTLSFKNTVQREKALRILLTIERDFCEGKNILLVDEAVFTGATLKIVTQTMREYGAKHIYAVIPSPRAEGRCVSGILKDKIMVSYGRSDIEVARYLGLDGIWFQNKEVFMEQMEKLDVRCSKCFAISE